MSVSKICLLIVFFVGINLQSAESDEQSNVNTTTINPLWKDNSNDRLKRDLLANYDKYSVPSRSPNTIVYLCMKAIHIDLDEHRGIFKIYVWLILEWQDPKLVWDPEEYENISLAYFGGHEVWYPEIVSFNSVDPSTETYHDTLILVHNDGSAITVPPHEYSVFCDMNFSAWPYDKQNCSLKLGTWSSRDIKIVANHKEHCMGVNGDVIVNEWKIESKYASNGTDPLTKFDYAEFGLVLQRQAPLYKAIIITPTSCIVLMILSGFWLPPQCGEKILLNGVCAILILAFLMYFGRLLPVLADHTPLIVLFLSSTLLLVSFSMIISVIVIYIADMNHEKRLPQWLRNILNGPIGKILCLSHLNTNIQSAVSNEDDEPKVDGTSSQDPQIFELSPPSITRKSIKNDWIVFAVAIDRCSFLIYCIIFTTLAIKYSV